MTKWDVAIKIVIKDDLTAIHMPRSSAEILRQNVEAARARQGDRPYVFNPLEGARPQALPPVPPDRQMQPQPRIGDVPGIVSQAIEGLCFIRAFNPQEFTRRFASGPLGGLPAPRSFQSATDRFFRTVCDPVVEFPPDLDPEPPFQGGQCSTEYNVEVLLDTFGPFNVCNPTSRTTGVRRVWGPIESIYLDYQPIGNNGIRNARVQCVCRGSGSGPTPGIVEVSFGQYSSSVECPFPRITSITVVPRDGSPDTCGDPQPDYPYNDQQIPPNLRFPIDPGNGEEPIEVVPGVDSGNNLTLQIGDVTVSHDGININFNFGGSPTQPQGLPGSGDVPRQIDIDTGADAERGADAAQEAVQLLEQGSGGCDLTPVLDKLECLDTIIREIAPRDLVKDEDPLQVGSIVSSTTDRVFYVTGARGNSGYLVLSITGNVPQSARIYTLSGTSSDVEAGFGNWSLFSPAASQNAPNTELHYLFTRNTVVPLDPERGLTGVRISLKPGVQMNIFDPGFSYIMRPLDNCDEG